MIYCYCRVSTEEQKVSGLGIEAQVQTCLRTARTLDGLFSSRRYPQTALPGFFIEEGVSAWKVPLGGRPAGVKLMRVLQPGDHLIIPRLDRAFRSVFDFASTIPDLLERGIHIHFCDQAIDFNSANGKFLANFLACVAQWESDMRSEYIRAAKAQRREQKKKQRDDSVWVAGEAQYPDTELFSSARSKGKALVYVRESHQDSADSGRGAAAQRKTCLAYAERMGLEVAGVFHDSIVSAYKVPFRQRAAAARLLLHANRGDHLIVARMDRAFRNVRDMRETIDDVIARGIEFHLVDQGMSSTSPTGKTMLTIVAAAAEWMAAVTSERNLAVAATLKSNGRPVNQKGRLGYKTIQRKKKKRLVIDWEEYVIGRYIEICRHYGLSYGEISDRLERILAQREDREVIPRCGKFLKRNKVLVRKWPKSRCFKLHQRMPELHTIICGHTSRRGTAGRSTSKT